MKERTINKELNAISGSDKIRMSVEEFPFKTVFTFKHLIDHWRNQALKEGSVSKARLALLEERLAMTPELLEPIEDMSILERHKDTLEFMIAPFFPLQSWNTELKGLGKAFSDRFFYTSPRFEKVIGNCETFILKQENEDNKNLTLFWRLLYAYKTILARFYNLSLVVDQPMIYTIPHLVTGLDHYYKLVTSPAFIGLEKIGSLPDLDNETFDYLVDNFHNIDLWMEYLPPENFAFSGFSIHSFVDVTVEEATARLENILLSNHGSISDESFIQLQCQLRIIFRLPGLRLGLATIQRDGALNLRSTKKGWNSLKIKEINGITPEDIDRSVYGKIMREAQGVIIEDIGRWESGTKIESELLNLGVKNIILSPLFYQEERVGLLEITSPNPGDINVLSSYKLKRVIQFFARAVHENRERFESRVQSVIKENFTAIHPTVEWRFREAAVHALDRQQQGESIDPEPIIFNEVFPLYGAADIRGSSETRNRSIRDDLLEHMILARNLLNQVDDTIPLVINKELDFTLEKKISEIRKRMNPADESSTIDFILTEINPLFCHLHQSYPALRPIFRPFMEQTQSGTDLLSNKRKAYESSLRTVNETISNHLLKEQQHLQKVFPHYFDKIQTDGVEYNMYIGQALVKNREFHPVYLRNLRLSQLISACEIARKIHDLKPKLEEPLLITQVILVYSTPINVRFRMEEKQFDVDGAYNVRYEIMKKRIDKAVVKGTEERVTQPGHIAVIYTMEKELAEYSRYIEFLQAQGYIKNVPEHLQLGELQGVQGLQALRLEVEMKTRSNGHSNGGLDILEVVRKMEE